MAIHAGNITARYRELSWPASGCAEAADLGRLLAQFALAQLSEFDRVAADRDRVLAGGDAVGDRTAAIEGVGERRPAESVGAVDPLGGPRRLERSRFVSEQVVGLTSMFINQ